MSLSTNKHKLLQLLLKTKGIQQSVNTIQPREGTDPSPLSYEQKQLWFLHELASGESGYVVHITWQLDGNLNVAVLEKSFQMLVQRHEILRTTIRLIDGEPRQCVSDEILCHLTQRQIRNVPQNEQLAVIQQQATSEARAPFDLENGPLLRVVLLDFGAGRYALLVTMHHIVSDAVSLNLFPEELSAIYDATLNRKPLNLSTLPIQYADYALWQQGQGYQERIQQELKYWRTQLEGAPPLIHLTPDRKRPIKRTFDGRRESMQLSAELTNQLHKLNQQAETTLFMTLLAGFNLLLANYTNQTDIVIGTPVAGRTQTQTENLLGYFVNTLALRTNFSPHLTIYQLLKLVQENTLNAFEHQTLHFAQLVEALAPTRTLSHNPIVQVVMVLQNVNPPNLVLPNVQATRISVEEYTAKFDLTLTFVPTEQGLRAELEYDAALFTKQTAQMVLNHLELILSCMVTNPAQKLRELPKLTVEETKLVSAWANQRSHYQLTECVHTRFASQVQQNPNQIAAKFGEQMVTYKALDVRANQLAHYLLAVGVRSGDRVGLCVAPSIDLLVGLLAILKVGAAYVPLDPTYPTERLAFIVEDAQIAVVLSEQQLKQQGVTASVKLTICLDTDRSSIAAFPKTAPDISCRPDTIAYVIYTSGSTGVPKGVLVTHQNVLRLFDATQDDFSFSHDDIWSLYHSFAFDFSVWEIWGALLFGGRLLIIPEYQNRDFAAFYDTLIQEQVTVLNQTPSAFNQLIQIDQVNQTAQSSLRLIIFGGEALSLTALYPWYIRHGCEKPQLVNMYGITETTVHTTYRLLRDNDFDNIGHSIIGRGLRDVAVYVLDDWQQLSPINISGELTVGGGGVTIGYLNRPKLTAESFIPDQFGGLAGSRLYRSGDLARYSFNGELLFDGRADYQVKVRGFRIELGEIESGLRTHPSVHDALVVVKKGLSDEAYLVAYVATPNQEITVGNLQQHLQMKLPRHMIPGTYVMLEQFPLTPSGKVNRAILPEPTGARPVLDTELKSAETEIERKLVQTWQAVLGVKEVGIYDNFFELGGDSILSMRMIAKAAEHHLIITPQQVFLHQTIAELANVVRDQKPQAKPYQTQQRITGDVSLTPIQAWFFEQSLPRCSHYNQSVLLKIPPDVEQDRLEQAVNHVVNRHEMLKARFQQIDSQWQQMIPGEDIFVPLQQFVFDEPMGEAEWRSIATDVHTSLNIKNGLCFRAALFQFTDTMRLLLVAHHLVVDTVSWDIIVSDLHSAYQKLPDQSLTLPQKTTSFQLWSKRLRTLANSDAFLQQGQYWLDQQFPPPLKVDQLVTINNRIDTDSVTVSLSSNDTDLLLREASKAYRTQINDLLLTALARAFRTWTGAGKLHVNLEGHGREPLFEDLNVSRTVGWFTSIYPVVLDLGDTPNLGKEIQQIKELLRNVPNKGIGYGMLRYLGDRSVEEALLQQPAAPISFNYLGQVRQAETQWQIQHEPDGQSITQTGQRVHLIEIDGGVMNDRLQFTWVYNYTIHTPDTVATLAQQFVQQLQLLIQHCLDTESGGLSPSDFPLLSIEQSQVDAITEHYPNAVDLYPLSPLQEGILFHTLSEPASGLYIEQPTYRLEGDLNVANFVEAWNKLVERHQIFRTAFSWRDGQLLQVVQKDVQPIWEFIDWRGLPVDGHHDRLDRLRQADRDKGFDPTVAPLMRLTLVSLSVQSYYFVWSHHHALLDGWSVPLTMHKVFAIYEALQQGKSYLRPQPPQYREYISWLQKQDLAAGETYWRQKLAGFVCSNPLNIEINSPSNVKTVAQIELALSAAFTKELNQYALQHRLTLNTVIQGAWAILLNRLSHGTDIVFGATTAVRPVSIPKIEEMIGLCLNTLPVRVQIDPTRCVVDWLRSLLVEQGEARQYAYCSLPQIHKWSSVPSGHALFETIVVFANYPDLAYQKEIGGIRTSSLSSLEQTNYALTLGVIPRDTLCLQLNFACEQFEVERATQLLRQYQFILEEVVRYPQAKLADLRTLPQETYQQMIVDWNATDVDYSFAGGVHEQFAQQVARTPYAIAACFNDQTLTYRALDERSNQLAHYLQANGVGSESRVGLCVERSLEMVVGIFGILKAGGVYIPIDPEYPQQRINFMLADAQADMVLTLAHLSDRVPIQSFSVVRLDSDWSDIESFPNWQPPNNTVQSSLAYMIYTSGSTGVPKGAMISHGALSNHMAWMQAKYPLTKQDCVLQKTPFSFDGSVWEFYAPLLVGAKLVMAKPYGHLDMGYLVETIVRQQVSIVQIGPSVLPLFLDDPLSDVDLYLKRVYCGGEPLTLALKNRFVASLSADLINLYGPTETTMNVTTWICNQANSLATVPIGRPVDNCQIYLLDNNLTPCPLGVPSELFVGGAGVGRGYWNQPALTAERFIPNPFGNTFGTRLYATGDLVRYLSDGAVDFIGRIDHQVKIGGIRVELGEIEAVLNMHPAVQHSVVVTKQESTSYRLIAYIVPQGAMVAPTSRVLRDYLQERLPRHMVPGIYVTLDQFPLTPSGKVDRTALPEPAEDRPVSNVMAKSAETEIEHQLVKIWQEVLGVKDIGIYDNFFELGGDSILSIRMIAQVAEHNLSLTPHQIFLHQTIAELATVVRDNKPREKQLKAQQYVAGDVALTPIQAWFFEQSLPMRSHYNQSVLLKVPQTVDEQRLEQAVNHVVNHHDMLRARFQQIGQQWLQTIPGEAIFVILKRFAFDAPVSEAPWRSVATAVHASLNIEKGLCLQAVLFQFTDETRLLLVGHHLVVDTISWDIIIADINTVYQQLSEGKPTLPQKTTSFQYWSQQLGALANQESFLQECAYWLDQTLPPPLQTEQPPTHNLLSDAASYTVALSASETDSLLHEASKAYRTQINDLLLTALARAFRIWTGENKLHIHLEGHGREPLFEDVDVSRTVGWFTSLFPVVLDLGNVRDLGKEIRQIKELLRDLPHKGIGYGILRYLSNHSATRLLPQQLAAPISFNYLGQAKQFDGQWQILHEPDGESASQSGERGHLIEIDGGVFDGQLQFTWVYNHTLHTPDTIAHLASQFTQQLQLLIQHCLDPDSGGLSQSDFPESGLGQSDLDDLLSRIDQL